MALARSAAAGVVPSMVVWPALVASLAQLFVACGGVQIKVHDADAGHVSGSAHTRGGDGGNQSDAAPSTKRGSSKQHSARSGQSLQSAKGSRQSLQSLRKAIVDLNKDRKQLEENSNMLKKDADEATQQLKVASRQLDNVSRLFADEKLELQRRVEEWHKKTEEVEAEKVGLQHSVGRLLGERGKYADEAHKAYLETDVKKMRHQQKLERESKEMRQQIIALQQQVGDRAAKEQRTLAQSASMSSAVEQGAAQAEAGVHKLSAELTKTRQELDTTRRANKATQAEAVQLAAAEKKARALKASLDSAEMTSDRIMTGSKVLYKANKEMQARLDRTVALGQQLREENVGMAQQAYAATAAKNAAAWYTQQAMSGAQASAYQMKQQKEQLDATVASMQAQNANLHKTSDRLGQELEELREGGAAITGQDSQRLLTEVQAWRANVSAATDEAARLRNRTAQLRSTNGRLEKQLEGARRALLGAQPPGAPVNHSLPLAEGIKNRAEIDEQLKDMAVLSQQVEHLKSAASEMSMGSPEMQAKSVKMRAENRALAQTVGNLTLERDRLGRALGQVTAKMAKVQPRAEAPLNARDARFKQTMEVTMKKAADAEGLLQQFESDGKSALKHAHAYKELAAQLEVTNQQLKETVQKETGEMQQLLGNYAQLSSSNKELVRKLEALTASKAAGATDDPTRQTIVRLTEENHALQETVQKLSAVRGRPSRAGARAKPAAAMVAKGVRTGPSMPAAARQLAVRRQLQEATVEAKAEKQRLQQQLEEVAANSAALEHDAATKLQEAVATINQDPVQGAKDTGDTAAVRKETQRWKDGVAQLERENEMLQAKIQGLTTQKQLLQHRAGLAA